MFNFPPIPPFPNGVRLARLIDISRIGLVTASGFYHSNVFTYERPGHNNFPSDTLAAYRVEYTRMILDPSSVVIVAEDTYKESEADMVDEPTRAVFYPWDKRSEKVIVAICSLRLNSGSSRIGQFQLEGLDAPPLQPDPENQGRDRDPEADRHYAKYTAQPKERILHPILEISTQVTHRAYWNSGHATKLAKWGLKLAEIDKVSIGVSASQMGAPFFANLGFNFRDRVEIKGYKKHPESIFIWFGTYDRGTCRRSDLKTPETMQILLELESSYLFI